ncbi:hypothetical protein QP179_20070 [Sphingomonas aurantiaca]|uniref:hypothetical protein n=1 Tax=Sphingomonas aurantiaca TaxID=185949 RepID=UPI002FE0E1D7
MSDDHEPDAAAEAFEGVRGELALLRRAVERLAAERAEVPEIPDYSETLGKMTKAVGAIDQRLAVLEKANEDGMAPRQIAASIVSASADARSEDRRTIVSAGEKMTDAVVSLHGIGNTARRAAEQKGSYFVPALRGWRLVRCYGRSFLASSHGSCRRNGRYPSGWRRARSACRNGRLVSA